MENFRDLAPVNMGHLRAALITSALAVASGAALLSAEVAIARSGVLADPGFVPAPGAAAGPLGPPGNSVVWLGDSTAAGVGSTSLSSTLPEQVAAALGQPVRLTVLAHSGDTVADVVRNQLPRVAAANPTEIFISIGANDVTHLTPRSAFRRSYAQMLAGLPPSVRRLVVLGVPDMGSAPRVPQPLRALSGWRGRMLDTDVRHILARAPGAVYVDIASTAGPAFRRDPHRYFAKDLYHPNDAGYAAWAAAVAAALRG